MLSISGNYTANTILQISPSGMTITTAGVPGSGMIMSTTGGLQVSPTRSTLTLSCVSSSCNLKCAGESSCQDLSMEENIWAIECEKFSCKGLTARCPKGQSCSAICNGISACRGAVFYGKWQVACEGISSCQDVTILEISQPITCRGVSSCQGLSATCTKGRHCTVICHGVSACQRARFEGKWNPICNGVSSCQNLALQESAESITCLSVSSCEGLTAHCGEGKSCSAVCTTVSACRGAILYGQWNID